MGLVTGLVDKEAMIAWADAEILHEAAPDDRIIELALSEKRSYSAIIWLLRDFQGLPNYDLALEALFARAGQLLAADPGRMIDILMGLRLLDEEEYLPSAAREPIRELKAAMASYRQDALPLSGLQTLLTSFLARFRSYEPLLAYLP